MRDVNIPLIVHIIHRLDYGGLENGLVNLINNMPVEEFRHAIICLAGFTEFRHRIKRDDVAVYSLEKRPGKDFISYFRLWRLLRKIRPTIVHTRNLGTLDMQWVSLAAGVQVRLHGEHGWEASDLNGGSRKSLVIRRFCRPVINRYVAMSNDIACWLQESVWIKARCITRIYNGVDLEKFVKCEKVPDDLPWAHGVENSPIVLGTVGRLDPVKNQSTLLRAFAKIVKADTARRGALRLIIAGGGGLAGELNRLAEELCISDLVWFPGARDDVAEVLRAMNVFVLPSLNEGISNTILEAMASSLPVVAARVGGNPELIISGETGMLFEPDDINELCSYLQIYISDQIRASRHGAAGRSHVSENFTLEKMVTNYTCLYKSMLAA